MVVISLTGEKEERRCREAGEGTFKGREPKDALMHDGSHQLSSHITVENTARSHHLVVKWCQD
jgi:hypothetical protein